MVDTNIIDENRVREIVKEELSNFNPPKKKRAPNKWQLFLKECAKRQDKELSYPEKVSLCSIEYKEEKNNNKQSSNNNSQK